MKVFVYGTLKRGYGNHRLLEGQKFLGEATTDVKFDMISGGFPVVFLSDTGLRLRGEVYEVDAVATLPRLDGLEGEGSMYDRKEIPVTFDNHDRSVVAMYIGNSDFWSWPKANQNERYQVGDVLEWSRVR